MKYAPAPWTLGDENGKPVILDSTGKFVIATIAFVNHPDQTDYANANLMSAAPEMFEALEEVVEFLESAWGASPYRLIVNKAIDKAKGESHGSQS